MRKTEIQSLQDRWEIDGLEAVPQILDSLAKGLDLRVLELPFATINGKSDLRG